MAKAIYGIGDIVTLRTGPLRNARTEGEFRVLTILPDTDGQVQYHVRSEKEGFDRRILANDIDIEKSARPTRVEAPALVEDRQPWFKPLSMRVGK